MPKITHRRLVPYIAIALTIVAALPNATFLFMLRMHPGSRRAGRCCMVRRARLSSTSFLARRAEPVPVRYGLPRRRSLLCRREPDGVIGDKAGIAALPLAGNSRQGSS